MKEWIFRLAGFLCGLLSLGCGTILVKSRYWRLWQFEDNVVQLVYIGLWEAYYYEEFYISGSVTRIRIHSPVNSTWIISPEFRCAQSLILLAMLIKSVVVLFNTAAIRVRIIKVSVLEMEILCSKCSVLFLVLSSLCTIISVTWNHVVDLYGKTTLDFPPTFPVRKAALIRKHTTHVISVGIVTTALSLLGVIMFLFDIRSSKAQRKLNAQISSKQANQTA